MMFGQRRAVHVRGDERVGVQRLLDWNAANKWRNLAGDFVTAAKHHVLAGWFYSSALQNISQSWSGEACRAYRTFTPLNAGNLRPV
jgi:hypothetical protein